jgi:hypothetical protein
MRVASGRIIDDRIEVDAADLPEDAAVTVLVSEGEEIFGVDEEAERMHLKSIAQCDRGQTVPLSQVLDEIR